MYAVFEDGSHQYKVSEGDRVQVDYRDVEVGARLEFPRVLLYAGGGDCQIGRPLLEGARVVGEVVEHTSKKYVIQHFRKRKNYRRKRGHRQHHLLVRVQHILLAGQEPPPAPPAASPETPAPEGQAPTT
jgi:large subunit ribosomal protein L21